MVNPKLNKIKNNEFYKLRFNKEKEAIELLEYNIKTNEYEFKTNINSTYDSLQTILGHCKYNTTKEVLDICIKNVHLWKELENKQKGSITNNINNHYALKYPPILIKEDNKNSLYIYNEWSDNYSRVNRFFTQQKETEVWLKKLAGEKDKHKEKIEKTNNWIWNNKIEFVTDDNKIKDSITDDNKIEDSITDDDNKIIKEFSVTDDNKIIFGLQEKYGSPLQQELDGIYFCAYKQGRKNEANDTKKLYHYKVADVVLTNIEYVKDILGIEKSYYKITFYNNMDERKNILKGSIQEISKEFESIADINQTKSWGQMLLTEFKNISKDLGFLKKTEEYSIHGFFIYNDKIIDNTKISEQYSNLSDNEKKQIMEEQSNNLIEFLNSVSKHTDNYLKIAKHMFIMPFSTVFKQIGYQEGLYYMELYGLPGVGKTTTTEKLMSIAGALLRIFSGASTKPSLRNEFNKTPINENLNSIIPDDDDYEGKPYTLPLLVDESQELLKSTEVQELLKEAGYGLSIKGTADNDRQGKNKHYKAYHHYIFTSNEANNIVNGLGRRILTFRFDKKLIDEEKRTFNQKFTKKNTIFDYLGDCFRQILIEKFNNEGESFITDKIPNDLINYVFEELEKQYNVDYSLLKEVNPYEDINTELNIDYAEICADNLQNDYYEEIRFSENKDISTVLKQNKDYKNFKEVKTDDKTFYIINDKKLDNLLLKKSNNNIITFKELLRVRELKNPIQEVSNKNDIDTTKEGVYRSIEKSFRLGIVTINKNTIIISKGIVERLFNI